MVDADRGCDTKANGSVGTRRSDGIDDARNPSEGIAEWLRGVLDTVGEAVIATDAAGQIQLFNSAAEKIFGYYSSDVIGKSLLALVPERLHSDWESHIEKQVGRQNGPPSFKEFYALKNGGREFPVEVGISTSCQENRLTIVVVIRDMSRRKMMDDALRRAYDELEHKVESRTRDLRRLSRQNEMILRSAAEGIVGIDKAGLVTFANKAASEILGISTKSMVESRFSDLVRTETGKLLPVRAALRAAQSMGRGEVTIRVGDRRMTAEFSISPFTDDTGVSGGVVVFRDITERKKIEERLQLGGAVFDTMSEAVVVVDSGSMKIHAVNPAFSSLTGHDAADAVGKDIEDFGFMRGTDISRLESGHVCKHEFEGRRKDGESYYADIKVSRISDSDHTSLRYVVVVNDVTERKRDQERIWHQANHDALTGLPNRLHFLKRLEEAMESIDGTDMQAAVLFIDLDGFKAINDGLGHEAGDELLKGVARRLLHSVRESDTVGRFGGDEFVAILRPVSSKDEVAKIAQRMLKTINKPFVFRSGGEGRVSGSVGIALYPQDGQTSNTVMKMADDAMYRAKNGGKNQAVFHSR